MEVSPAQFVTTADGVAIAWTKAGSGPPLVIMPALGASFLGSWQRFPDWFSEISKHFTVVQYDGRGEGLSMRGLSSDLTMSDLTLDLEAVLAAFGSPRVVLFATGGMTHVALRFAAAQPERVDALVLNTCAIANASWGMTLWRALPAENYQYFQETLVPPGLSVEERKRWLDEHRNTMTFEDYDIYSRVLMAGVVEEVLPHVQTPVLVIHQTHWTSLPQHESMRLAAALPKGRFVIDDGLGYYPRSSTVQVIVEFMAGLPLKEVGSPVIRPLDGLSARELDVLRLIAAGRSNAQIAEELVISINTVGRHVSNIFDKLGFANRAEAATYALRQGLV